MSYEGRWAELKEWLEAKAAKLDEQAMLASMNGNGRAALRLSSEKAGYRAALATMTELEARDG